VIDAGDRGLCEIHVFSHVAAQRRAAVGALAFNDLIAGVASFMPDQTLTDVQKLTGTIPVFHTRSQLDACVNHTGRLVHYRGFEGEDLTVYNDGGIEYRALGSYYSERDVLSPDERAALLRAFAAVNFDALPETLPKPDWGPQPALVLSGLRYQPVSLYGHESAPEPARRAARRAAAKAEAHVRSRLVRGTSSAAEIVPWPLNGVDLARFYDLTGAAAQQQRQGPDWVPGDFADWRQSASASIPRQNLQQGSGGHWHRRAFTHNLE
jgi:hypothetical protein